MYANVHLVLLVGIHDCDWTLGTVYDADSLSIFV